MLVLTEAKKRKIQGEQISLFLLSKLKYLNKRAHVLHHWLTATTLREAVEGLQVTAV